MFYQSKQEKSNLKKVIFFKRLLISFFIFLFLAVLLFFVYLFGEQNNLNEKKFYFYSIITFVFLLFFLFVIEISSLIINPEILKKKTSILFFIFYLASFIINFLFFNSHFIFFGYDPLNNSNINLFFPSFDWIYLLCFFLLSFLLSFFLTGTYFYKHFLITFMIIFFVFFSHIFLALVLINKNTFNTTLDKKQLIDPFWTFLYLFTTTFIFDISAYIFSIFYKKKGDLCPCISKNKTKMAFLFGTAISFFYGSIFVIIYSFTNEPNNLVNFFFNNDTPISYLNLIFLIFISLIIPIFSQIGDLFFSKIKRENKIKDFSRSLGEHGGFLDRFDSVIFSFSIFFLFFICFNYSIFFTN